MIWRPLALRYYINYTPMKTNIERVGLQAIGIDVSKADLHIALTKIIALNRLYELKTRSKPLKSS